MHSLILFPFHCSELCIYSGSSERSKHQINVLIDLLFVILQSKSQSSIKVLVLKIWSLKDNKIYHLIIFDSDEEKSH